MNLIFTVALSAVAVFLLIIIIRKLYSEHKERKAITEMCDKLFPEGDMQKESTIDDIYALTKGRFNRDDILDYYLKIKGLQILDLHANSDKYICAYLMKPTKIRLNYYEQVLFYERFLNYPQAEGVNAVNSNTSKFI